ncbi:MAG: hypothetical protein U0871_01890 [Gemmataceae bacterium]
MSVTTRATAERPAVESELVTYRDIARLMQVSEKTVTRLPVPGRVAVGRLVRFDRRTVLAWIAGGCQPR